MTHRHRIVFLFIFITLSKGLCQNVEKFASEYETAFATLIRMLDGREKINFKKAVLTTEKAFLDKQLDTLAFDRVLTDLTTRCRSLINSNLIDYDKKDKNEVIKWAAIFKVMTDTSYQATGQIRIAHLPFRYDFEDFFGEDDWTKMFVSKLLDTNTGNCHSMPYLYKIIAEELGTTANLSLAPNHIYIKHRCLKSGWYNTELTSAAFPIDAWLMASGYIHLDAIQNGVYMKALNDKESIALCLIDLAEGYKRKTNNSDPDFILKCCATALNYFPNYINALILKAETLKMVHDGFVKDHPRPDDEAKAKADEQFLEMQNLYVRVHELGYRQMPKEMYLNWLVELKTEKEKYQNSNVVNFNK